MKDQPLRVLMIEDSEDDALLTIRELEKGGYNPSYERVQTASGMEKALMEKQWDIILCDYQMPQFNAPAAIALLKKAKMDIPMIIVSGTIGEDVAVECMRLGAQDYFVKGKLLRLCPAIARELSEAEDRRGRRQAEERLRQSEARFKSIVSTSREWIWAIDATGVFTFSNPAIENILGYTPGEIILQGAAANLVSEEDMPKMKEILSRSVERKKGWSNLVLRWKHKDGTYRYLESNAAPIIDSDGSLTGFQGSGHDVTERMLAEASLRKSENKFRLMTEQMSDIAWIADMNLQTVYVTPSIRTVLGFTQQERIRQTVSEQLTPESLTAAMEAMSRELTLEARGNTDPSRIIQMELEFYHKDGSTRWLDAIISGLRNEQGVLTGIHGVARDVTRRKHAEDALKESEQRLTAAQRIAKMGDITWDYETGEVTWSEALYDLMQYDKSQNIYYAHVDAEIHHPEDRTRINQWLNDCIASGKDMITPNEYRIIRKDGAVIFVHTEGVIQRREGKRPKVFMTLQDISDRKRAEEALRESEEKYRLIFEYSPLAHFYFDENGTIVDCNDNLVKIIGSSKEALLGVNLLTLPDHKVVKATRKALGGETIHYEDIYHSTTANKSTPIRAICAPLTVGDNRILGGMAIIEDITERKQTEDALRESEKRHRLLADNAIDVIWTINLDEVALTYVSPSIEKLTGYTPEECLRLPFPEMFTAGSFDIIQKIISSARAALKAGLPIAPIADELEQRRKDGLTVWTEVTATGIYDPDGKFIELLGVSRNISDRKEAEEKIKHLATHDALTDLPTLRLGRDRLSMALNLARRNKTMAAVLFIDLDGFKEVNDSLGHDAGDYVLKQVAQRLLSCVRKTDTVARLGGDEFLIVVTELRDTGHIKRLAEKIIREVSEPVIYCNLETIVGASIGIALFPDNAEENDLLIKLADDAMYGVKKSGKNGFRFANPSC
jgi:diguanylate cyclase (GGDEF)-like protein/PAS domain S-box-containing protein